MDVVRELLNESCYYKLLDVEFDATYEEIRKKYRERALAFHPDKRPAEEKEECKNLFQKIQQAYECLSNDEVRNYESCTTSNVMEERLIYLDTKVVRQK